MRKPLPQFGTAVKDELRSKFVRIVKFGRRGKKNLAPSQHCKGKDSWSLISEKQHPRLIRNQTNPRKQCLVLVKSSRGKTKVAGYAVTNARFASLHGLPVARPPLDDARSTPQTARSSRAYMAQGRRRGGLPSAARRRALRSGCDSLCASLRPPLHFPGSPTADRSNGDSISNSS